MWCHPRKTRLCRDLNPPKKIWNIEHITMDNHGIAISTFEPDVWNIDKNISREILPIVKVSGFAFRGRTRGLPWHFTPKAMTQSWRCMFAVQTTYQNKGWVSVWPWLDAPFGLMFSQTPFQDGHVHWVRPQPQLGALSFFCASTQSQSHYPPASI